MRGGTTRITFRVGPVALDLTSRVGGSSDAGSLAGVAQRDLRRYYRLLASGLLEASAADLTRGEIDDALLGKPVRVSDTARVALIDAYERSIATERRQKRKEV